MPTTIATAVEVYEQTGGNITHFVATIGTGGTIMGTGRRLKEYNKKIFRLVAVEPDDPFHGLEGLKTYGVFHCTGNLPRREARP